MGEVKISFVVIFYLTGINFSSSQDKEGFVLVKKDGAISVFERWITFPNSDPPIEAREVKGEFFFNNNMFAGLNLLQNESKIQEWQKHVSEFKVYPQNDTSTWLEYSYHDIPWPVSDQDHFLQYKIDKIVPGKSVFLTFESKEMPSIAPVRKGVTRMELSGSWTLEQIGPYRTKATYRILSKPIGIPKWLTDPIIRNNIVTTIEEYVALLEPDAD
jgi:hypothetical protein